MREPGIGARLALFYGSYFAVIGILTPFLPLWLSSRGLAPTEIGMVFSAALVAKLVAEPLLARFADMRGGARGLMILLAVLACLAYINLSFSFGLIPILLAAALAAMLLNPILPMGESLVLRTIARTGHDYGRIRLWGSLAFIMSAVAGGMVLKAGSADATIWIVAAMVVILALVCIALPEERREPGGGGLLSGMRLLRERNFVLFLIATGATTASHGVYYGFSSIEWQRLGLDKDTIGILWAIGVVAEIVLFWLAGRYPALKNPRYLMMAAALGGMLRWTCMPWFESFTPFSVLQVLHGLTFGAMHLGAMGFLARYLPDDLSASGQGLFYALSGGLVMGIVMPFSGWLYNGFGPMSWLVMAGFSVISLIAVLALRHPAHR